MRELYDKCLKIATEAHKGQMRKFGVNLPYIMHPLAVADKFSDESLKCIAVLHDVIEDTPITANKLSELGIPKNIVEAVEILSRRKGEEYFAYIERIIKSNNIDAMIVKQADVEDNMKTAPESLIKGRYDKTLKLLKERSVV